MKILTKLLGLIKQTYNRMWDYDIGLHGAGVAFYAIFSTAPLIIILLWIASMILGNQVGQAEFQETLRTIVGPDLTSTVTDVAQSTAQGGSGLWSTLIATITLLFGATTLLSQMKDTLNAIWGIKNPQLSSVWYFLWDRLMGLLFILALSLLFLTSLISESLLYGLESLLLPLLGDEALYLIQLGSSLINFFFTFTFFIVMFRILPDLEARWRDLAVGALFTTLLFLAGKALVGWYLGTGNLAPAYKAAGSFVVFLIWIYYNVQVVLIGAIFTQVYTSRYGGEVHPYWGSTLKEDYYR